MKAPALSLAAFVLLAIPASAQSSDFPGGSDLRSVARPANSTLIGALHIDNDEYQVPVGPVERGQALGKSVKVTGPIDTVAYAGPKSASTLTTFNGLSSQLLASGYVQTWSCAREACGSAYSLSNILFQPLVDSIHTGEWAGMIIDDLSASNEDIRYGAYRKGTEYLMVVAALQPGNHSGALLVRVNGPADDPVLRAQ